MSNPYSEILEKIAASNSVVQPNTRNALLERIATLQRELEQERKRAAERDDYIKSMDAIWEEYIEKQLPGFEHLVEFLTDPANAEAIDAAIAQAEGGINADT